MNIEVALPNIPRSCGDAQAMANHFSARRHETYDRRDDELTLDEYERGGNLSCAYKRFAPLFNNSYVDLAQ